MHNWVDWVGIQAPYKRLQDRGQQTEQGTMELSMLLLLAVLTGLVLLLVRGHPKTRGHLPPGPRPLPFLGNLLQMDMRGLLSSFLRVRHTWMGTPV